MHADKIIKIINKTVDSFKYQKKTGSPPFKIPEKALIVLPNFIGDVILFTPVLRNLRYNFGKKAKIDAVINSNMHNLLETLPYIDDFYLLETQITNKISFLKEKNYDTILLFNFPFLWALASYRTKINQRVSFNLERIGLNYPPVWQDLITHFVRSTPIDDKTPQREVYLNILRDLDLTIFDNHTEINLTKADINKANKLIKDIPRPHILIHAASGSPGKNWDYKNWTEILKYLKNKYNCDFISTGTKFEAAIYDYLSAQSGVKIHNLCGKTTLRETLALYSHLDLVITLDSSPAHLAAAANTKNIIIIYGPTNEAQWLPYSQESNIQQVYLDLACRPCMTRLCHHRKCLNELNPELVIEAIDRTYMNF